MLRKILGASQKSVRFNAIVKVLGPGAAAASAALLLWHAGRDLSSSRSADRVSLIHPSSAGTGASAAANGTSAGVAGTSAGATNAPAPAAATIEVVVGRNDTMDGIFRRMALDKADLAAIRNLPGIRQSLDFLRPGDAIQLTRTHDGEIKALSRKVSETQTLTVVREDAGFAARMVSNPVDSRIRTATATIDSSLFQAAAAANVSDLVALKLAGVFAWDIDFAMDIRSGDRFTVAYEQIYQDGKYLHDGEILAAEFTNGGRTYRAVRFTPDGGSAGYFTPDGKPLRKAFLRAPVEFTRVSSVFDVARMHPILNRIRGHMGTDYAAPTGTPIHAAGEGRVSFAGVRGGYGNAIMLLHSNNVSTLYGHMSRFARNMRLGSHVNQGEVIGYVGMTGLATGPHLHYEYLMNGVHMNPETVRLPGAEPLQADVMGRFQSYAASLLASLAVSSAPASVSAAAVEELPTPAAAADLQASGDPAPRTSVN